MRWQGRGGSQNVEDRRGGGGGGFPGGRLALGGGGSLLLVAVVLVAGYYGIDLTPLLSDAGGITSSSGVSTLPPAEEREMAEFTSVALKTTEDTWDQVFASMGQRYSPPRLVMYNGVTETGCGYGQGAMGPFYCPGDETVYIDLSYERNLLQKF